MLPHRLTIQYLNGGYGAGLSTPGVLAVKDVSALSSGSSAGAGGAARHYTVAYGESLWNVAEKNGLEPGRLLELNPQIKNLNQISAGQVLRIS